MDNFHAGMKNAMVELVKGRESVIQLQAILREPVQDHEPVALQQLALQIYRSLSDSLSELSPGTGPTKSDRIPASDGDGSACSGERGKKPKVKDRRGCYKRRRSSDSWVTVSSTSEDGCAWRKYGQKTILNSEYPRCYFRCTHKQDGCKALKQVQRVKGAQVKYQTTYINHHTCKQTLKTPPLMMESDPIDPNLISFQTPNKQNEEDDHVHNKSTSKPLMPPLVEQEDNLSETASHETRSTSDDTWHDIIGLEQLGCNPIWAPYQEVESVGRISSSLISCWREYQSSDTVLGNHQSSADTFCSDTILLE